MEPLKNLPNFYVGQKVICIDNSNTNGRLLLNRDYVVTGIGNVCKCITIEVSYLKSIKANGQEVKVGEICKCLTCGSTLISTGFHNYRVSRFAPLQQKSFPLMTYSKVIEKERELISQN